jgi:hypothetical protein
VTAANPRKTAKNRQSREAAKENVKDRDASGANGDCERLGMDLW